MGNRRFEVFEYRQVLARMRQGDSDPDIARAGLMGRKKLATIRDAALQHDWLNPARPLPDDAVLAAMSGRNPQLPRTCVSTLEPFRELITQWFNADIQGTTIHSALQRNHGYTGSYSAVRRFLQALSVERGVKATTVLEFAPVDAAQIDFGAGPQLLDAAGKPVKMWFFVATLCWPRHQYPRAREKPLLSALPDVPPVLAGWTKVSVHRGCHVQFHKGLYSVPCKLVGHTLWLKATDTAVQLFREHELVAVHPRLHRAGTRSTVRDHLPPEAQAWQMHDPQWCLAEAKRIGTACHPVVLALFNDQVLVNLRGAQGILQLEAKVGAVRLEAACHRAMSFSSPRYRTVKTILDKGLDQLAESAQPELIDLGDTYARCGRFCRDLPSMISH